MAGTADLPVGMAGLKFPITQVSLVIEDVDALLERYYSTFGWAPWQDFDHVPPVHRNTMYRGRELNYSLRGAEVYVGSLNFELLKPLPGGQSVFHDHLERRGEGIAAIASMFHDRADGDAVKVAFKEQFGLDVITKANIGDHIEYYYVDSQESFGCPIESGSGHAHDFHPPARIYPHAGAEAGPAPDSGIRYRISQVTLVVRDLDEKMRNYTRAFGWGPWQIYDLSKSGFLEAATFRGKLASYAARLAQVEVGDLNFEIVQPQGGASPWQEFLDRSGEGLMGIGVMPEAPAGIEDVSAQFSRAGIGTLASADTDSTQWRLFETQETFKTLIAVTSGHLHGAVAPTETRS